MGLNRIRQSLRGLGEEADDMRIASTLAFAAIGVVVLAHPCAAQSGGVSVTPKSSTASKREVAPQRLSPPALPDFRLADEANPPSGRDASLQGSPTQDADVAVPALPETVAPAQTVRTERVTPAAIAPRQTLSAPIPTRSVPDTPSSNGTPARAGPHHDFGSAEHLLDWVSNYRDRPELWKVPAAVHAMRDHSLFTDEEQRWFCIGFVAGVLGTNPNDGPKLIPKMFPMPPKEQEVIIRAIAYSGRPDWRDLLEKNAAKMPLRRPLIDDFLNGRRPTLQDLELDLGGAQAVYAHWGYYVASGQHEPVVRIMQALKWSKGAKEEGFFGRLLSGWGADANALDKITTGGTAKWTLASYAERDRELIGLYRAEIPNQPEEIGKPLKDVIDAAELFEAEKIRKEQYGAIEDAQRQQLTADAGMSKGWTAGSIAIATGCVAASALGQAQIAVPCVIGGALYSGAGKLAR